MKQFIALSTSFGTLITMWLTGNKKWYGWAVGLANQIVWVTFIIMFDAYGLLPLFVALVVIYTRNLIKWRREDVASHHLKEYDASGGCSGSVHLDPGSVCPGCGRPPGQVLLAGS